MKIVRYLRLMRAPNVLTAIPDVVAGYFLLVHAEGGRGGRLDPREVAPVCAIGALIYAAGIVFNDIADLEEDRQTRPNRPLPSGAVPLSHAWLLGGGFLVIALVIAMTVGAMCFYQSLALAMVVLLYDFSLKSVPVAGPIAMGLCRAMNLQLGLSVSYYFPYGLVAAGWTPEVIGFPLFYLCYIAAITHLSKMEEATGENARRKTLQALAVLVLSIAGRTILAGFGIWTLVWLPLDLTLLLLFADCARLPSPGKVRASVMTGVFGVPIWAAGLAVSCGPPFTYLGLALAAATPAAYLLGKLLRQREA